MNFNHSDKWRMECSTHRLEVMHNNRFASLPPEYTEIYENSGDGGHHWTLYVTLFEAHPMFKSCLNNGTSNALDIVNPHCGFQFFEKLVINDKHTVLKYGCDYNHYGDEYETTLSENEFEETSAYRDAVRIFNLLKELKPTVDEYEEYFE